MNRKAILPDALTTEEEVVQQFRQWVADHKDEDYFESLVDLLIMGAQDQSVSGYSIWHENRGASKRMHDISIHMYGCSRYVDVAPKHQDYSAKEYTFARHRTMARQLAILGQVAAGLAPTDAAIQSSDVLPDATSVAAPNETELTLEENAELQRRLHEIQSGLASLLVRMDDNVSLLEDSVREVRTARRIAAESNRVSRRRASQVPNTDLAGSTK